MIKLFKFKEMKKATSRKILIKDYKKMFNFDISFLLGYKKHYIYYENISDKNYNDYNLKKIIIYIRKNKIKKDSIINIYNSFYNFVIEKKEPKKMSKSIVVFQGENWLLRTGMGDDSISLEYYYKANIYQWVYQGYGVFDTIIERDKFVKSFDDNKKYEDIQFYVKM